MRNVLSLSLVFCLIVLLGNVIWASGALEYKEVDFPKMRAGFVGWWGLTDVVPRMKQSGMTHVIVAFGHLRTPIQKRYMDQIHKWADLCQKAGIKFMPLIITWGKGEKEWIHPRYNYYYDGIEYSRTPCPLEIDVYKLAVHKRVLELAKLSQSIPIAGIIIDLEMDGKEVWQYPDYCLCDYCFERFLSGIGVREAIPKSKRQDYLVKSKQVKAYRKFMEDSIEQLAKQTKEQLETIAPDLIIGAALLDLDKPYNRGLAKGLGRGHKPVLAFTEKTYRTGYSSYIYKTQKRLRDSGTNAKLMVGIWQDKFSPENLAQQYYHCAKSSAGYWIYTIRSLSSITVPWFTPSQIEDRRLPFPKNDYWHAITVANKELDKLSLDPNYVSFLKTPALHKLKW